MPGDVDEYIAFISNAEAGGIRIFRGARPQLVAEYVGLARGIRRIWGNDDTPEIKSAAGK